MSKVTDAVSAGAREGILGGKSYKISPPTYGDLDEFRYMLATDRTRAAMAAARTSAERVEIACTMARQPVTDAEIRNELDSVSGVLRIGFLCAARNEKTLKWEDWKDAIDLSAQEEITMLSETIESFLVTGGDGSDASPFTDTAKAKSD